MRTFLRISLAATALATLAACSGNPERQAVETYFAQAEDLSTELSDTGTKFETITNLHGDTNTWTDAEKTELRTTVAAADALTARAKALSVPPILSGAHPLLVQALTELADAMRGVLAIAENPEAATEADVDRLDALATDGVKHAEEFLQKVKTDLQDTYPDLVSE